ncbi:efflux transporter outer membrane subunit [Riemerella anatipestifer]|uniref:TolC family protein n=1 Tax=Riemerella anatipestifer TaxID=34085 RepID=UPI0021D6027A|nr:efflux transporter outer membrane subunit [Riemerella anatipestifer]MCU7587383.1 efflux transporter outer membrane subunit [Riemerella anatipestifer]
MKTKLKYISLVVGSLVLVNCKAPTTLQVKDNVKETLPESYTKDEVSNKSTGTPPWREFFTDPHLVSLIETALNNNQELLITLQEIEKAKSSVMYRNGRLLPSVSVEAAAGVKKVGRYTSEGAGDASTQMEEGKPIPDPLGNFGIGLQADWEVDIWNKLRTEKKSAIAHYLATVDGKNFVLSSLIAEVARSYYELLALDSQYSYLKKYIELQRKALEVSKIQKQAAATTELSVKKFEAELAKSSANLYTVQQSILEKENDINLLLGRFYQPIPRSSAEFLELVPQSIKTGIPSELLANRPDVKQAELELEAAKLDVEAARKEFYPSLNITFGAGLEAFKPSYFTHFPESLAYNIVGDLVGPLINKSAIKAKFNTANASQLQALYEYNKTLIKAYMEVSNNLNKIKNYQQYFDLKHTQSKDLDEAIGISNLLFTNARADYMEVLMTQRDALDAKMELIEAKNTQLNATVYLYKSLGGGWK